MLLLSNFKTPTEWLYDNYMILNLVECSYICLSKYSKDDDTSSFSEFVLKIVVVETIIWQKKWPKINFWRQYQNFMYKVQVKNWAHF